VGFPRFCGHLKDTSHNVREVFMGRKKKQPKSPRGKRYSKEFKAGAVKLVRESEMNLNQLAKQLGVSRRALELWVRQADIDEGRGPAGALTSAEREELRRLRREIRELRMVTEILKKAEAFFAAKKR